jgi:hypothetical protein
MSHDDSWKSMPIVYTSLIDYKVHSNLRITKIEGHNPVSKNGKNVVFSN